LVFKRSNKKVDFISRINPIGTKGECECEKSKNNQKKSININTNINPYVQDHLTLLTFIDEKG
jgi:hypothetical protein